jgi:hypothetical protein
MCEPLRMDRARRRRRWWQNYRCFAPLLIVAKKAAVGLQGMNDLAAGSSSPSRGPVLFNRHDVSCAEKVFGGNPSAFAPLLSHLRDANERVWDHACPARIYILSWTTRIGAQRCWSTGTGHHAVHWTGDVWHRLWQIHDHARVCVLTTAVSRSIHLIRVNGAGMAGGQKAYAVGSGGHVFGCGSIVGGQSTLASSVW